MQQSRLAAAHDAMLSRGNLMELVGDEYELRYEGDEEDETVG